MYSPQSNQGIIAQHPQPQLMVVGGQQVFMSQPATMASIVQQALYDEWSKVFSIVLLILQGVSNITTIICLFIIRFYSYYNDYYNTYGITFLYLTMTLGFGLMINRVIIAIWYSMQEGSTTSEKMAVAMTPLLPLLKYHLMRLNVNYQGKFKALHRNDIAGVIWVCILGIFSIITYANSSDYYYYYSYDGTFLLVGLMCLCQSFCLWPMLFCLHRMWITKTTDMERLRRVGILSPLLANQMHYGGVSEQQVIYTQPSQPTLPAYQQYQPGQPNTTTYQSVQPNVTAYQPNHPNVATNQPGQPNTTTYQSVQPNVTAYQPSQPNITAYQPNHTNVATYQTGQPNVAPYQPDQPNVIAYQPNRINQDSA